MTQRDRELIVMLKEAVVPAESSPKVFISYSHDSEEHKDRVFDLSERLRSEGIHCHIDQYEMSPAEGWPRWMRNRIREADFVLVACTATYERRFEGNEQTGCGAGAKWEGTIITQELYESEGRNKKFIPVAFSPEDARYIPIEMRSGTWYIIDTEKGYEELYRHLTGQPRTIKGELGKLRSLPTLNRRQDFSNATAVESAITQLSAETKNTSATATKAVQLVLIISPEGRPIILEALRVKSGETIQMSLLPEDGRQVASLEMLKKKAVKSNPLPIAFGTTALTARLQSLEHVLEEGREVWYLVFQPDERGRSGFDFGELNLTSHPADEIAEMRARRILLDEKLPGSRYRGSSNLDAQMLESAIRGFQTPIQVEDSPFPALYSVFNNNIPVFLAAARLYAVLRLLLTNTIEHIHVLDLKMKGKTELTVTFEGERPARYSGEEPYILRLEGICNLTKGTA